MTTNDHFDLHKCSRGIKNAFSLSELRMIWSELRALHQDLSIHDIKGDSTEVVGKYGLTLGEFALIYLHFKASRARIAANTCIPVEEWWALIESQEKAKEEAKEEFPFHLFEEETQEIETLEIKEPVTIEEKRLRRRHTRRLREGLNSCKEFPCLSGAQVRLYLAMIRTLTTFPVKQAIGMYEDSQTKQLCVLTLEDFAIRYVLSEQWKRYLLKLA